MRFHVTEQLKVENADEKHWNAVGPGENAGDKDSRIIVISQEVKRARCEKTERKKIKNYFFLKIKQN